MENNHKIIFVRERNEMLFQATLQKIFDDLCNTFNIEVQYQIEVESSVLDKSNLVYYTALVIARRK